MYYATVPLRGRSSQGRLSQLTCLGVDQPGLLSSMPADSDAAPPSRPELEENTNQFSHRHHHLSG